MKALSIAATGMLAQQLNVEVISNNIANMNTTAYKRQRAEFQDLLYQNIERAGAASSDAGTVVPTGIQIGVGVRTAGVYRIASQGELINSDTPLDLAINGKGYFRVQLPSGEDAYTRAGSFQLSPQGEIVNSEGFPISPGITIPQEAIDISINANGEVMVKIDGQLEPQNVGQFELVTFPNNAGLQAIGDNLLLETPASGDATIGAPNTPGYGSVVQGYLERSNVNSVTEITMLIAAQRAYEMNSKVISTADEMLQTTSNLR